MHKLFTPKLFAPRRFVSSKIAQPEAVLRALLRALAAVAAACWLGVATSRCSATTKGLNQIPTPDLQPSGQLSLSYQLVQPQIDNADQLQGEYGINKKFELAAVQGFKPTESRLGGEYGLVQRRPYLLSVGFLNYSSLSPRPQAFVEAGYYKGSAHLEDKYQVMGGALLVSGQAEGIAGGLLKLNRSVWLSADYQSGAENFSTLGVTFSSKSGKLVFNPAIYWSNSTPRHSYGYAVLTYTFDFNARKKPPPDPGPKSQNPAPGSR